MIEMCIDSIRVSLVNQQRVVILKEKTADRYLPIWIGPAEADAIAIKLQQIPVSRPLTHDLLSSVITTLGARISFIDITDLQSDTFYAKLILDFNSGGQVEVDSRPSDAIALAIRAQAPIYAEEPVLDHAGFILDKQTGEPRPATSQDTVRSSAVGEDELKRLSAFSDFISTLDLDGLGKDKPSEKGEGEGV